MKPQKIKINPDKIALIVVGLAILVVAVLAGTKAAKSVGKKEAFTGNEYEEEFFPETEENYREESSEYEEILSLTNSNTTIDTQTPIASTTERFAEKISTTIATTLSEISTSETTTKKKTSQKDITTTEATTLKEGNTFEYGKYGFDPQPVSRFNLEDDTAFKTVIINRAHSVPQGYVPELAPSITGDSNSYKLDKRVAPHYNEMYLAAKKDGIILTPISGYRSYEKQKTNFENKISRLQNQYGYERTKAVTEASKVVLPPGVSEHNIGIAMDICSLEQSFENSKEFKWLNEHAAEYGFILRYPKNKEDITKIIYEPWHWRYVGVENAQKIKDSGLCMEEYYNETA